jgi:molybdopterin adenylyltransferase
MKVGILTLSDTRTPQTDESGRAIEALVKGAWPDAEIYYDLVADDLDCIKAELIRFCDDQGCRLVLTTGGTGVAPRDVTPEATMAVCERLVPGLGEAQGRPRVPGGDHAGAAPCARAAAGREAPLKRESNA